MTAFLDESLIFFEEFLLKGGFKKVHEDFFQTYYEDDDGNYHQIGTGTVSVEEEWREMIGRTDVISSTNPDECHEEEFIFKQYFSDYLVKQLNGGLKETKKYIRDRIVLFEYNQEKITSFLRVVLNDLVSLVKYLKSEEEYIKYPQNIHAIYRLLTHLFSRYSLFLSQSEFPIYIEARNFLQSSTINKGSEKNDLSFKGESSSNLKSKEIKGFKWKSNTNGNTLKLYSFLTENSCISKNDFEKLEKAFKGDVLNEPLNIKWLLTTNHGDTKPVIFKVISVLMFEMKLLEQITVQSKLAKTIETVFCHSDGAQIIHLNITISQLKNSKGIIKGMLVENLLSELRKIPFSETIAENS